MKRYKYSRKQCNKEIENLKRIFTDSQIMPGGWLETVEQYLHATQLMLLATVESKKEDLVSDCCGADFDAFGRTDENGNPAEVCNKCGKDCDVHWGIVGKSKKPIHSLPEKKEIEKLTNDDFDGSDDHDAINFLWEWNIEMQKKINEIINHLSSKEK